MLRPPLPILAFFRPQKNRCFGHTNRTSKPFIVLRDCCDPCTAGSNFDAFSGCVVILVYAENHRNILKMIPRCFALPWREDVWRIVRWSRRRVRQIAHRSSTSHRAHFLQIVACALWNKCRMYLCSVPAIGTVCLSQMLGLTVPTVVLQGKPLDKCTRLVVFIRFWKLHTYYLCRWR